MNRILKLFLFLIQLFQKVEKIIIFAIHPKGFLWVVMVVVAQLVRAPDCGSGGRRFEPGLPPDVASYAVLQSCSSAVLF